MAKYFFTLLFTTLCSFSSFGQLPAGFIAPDFTVTDLNGEEHNLYTILDEGKTVIVDIYATWCSPCWTFHSDHVLADIWEELGPNGADEVFVMSIESDLSTNFEDLNGTGTNTQGNWIDGTPYPMVDEIEGQGGVGNIANDYFVVGYPTIYFICPDRSVSELNWQVVESQYMSELVGCPSLQGELNCRLNSYDGIEGVICTDETFTPKVTFQNLGNQVITEATFSITINGGTEELNWTGSLNPFAIEEVAFSEVTAANTDVIIELLDLNNSPDETPGDNTIETSILAPSITEMDTVTIEIMTDEFGAETYWAVLNENDEIVGEGGNQLIGFDQNIDLTPDVWPPPSDSTAYEGNTLYTTDVYLPVNGCYRLIVADYYLDGFCCAYGDGYFKVISQDNGVLFDGTGTEFGQNTEGPFAYNGVVGTSTQVFSGIKIFPNPVANRLTIELTGSKADIQIVNIFDLQGKNILKTDLINANEDRINLDLSVLHSGLYLLQLKLDDGQVIQQKIFKE